MSRAEIKLKGRYDDDDDDFADEPKWRGGDVKQGGGGGSNQSSSNSSNVGGSAPSKPPQRRDDRERQQQKEIDNFGSDSDWVQSSNYGKSSSSTLAESKNDGNKENSGMLSSFSSLLKGKSAENEDSKIDYVALKESIMRPRADKDNFVHCYIERDDSFFGSQVFRCFLEGDEKQKTQRIMTARKETAKKTCYYLITMDDGGDRANSNLLGKLRGQDFVSSQYLITDGGMSYKNSHLPSSFRKEFGVIFLEYESNRPSTYKIWIPRVTGSIASTWQPANDESTMLAKINDKKNDNLTKLVNKMPKWDSKINAHVLNFQGRVKEASIKNFQLCIENPDGSTIDNVVLQFGKVSKDKFCMDIKSPLSLFQAFSICISMLDKGKIADRKGYEILSRIPGVNSSRDSAPVASAPSNSNSSSSSSESRDDKDSEPSGSKTVEVSGSMQGSSSIGEYLSQALPSMDYFKNKVTRASK